MSNRRKLCVNPKTWGADATMKWTDSDLLGSVVVGAIGGDGCRRGPKPSHSVVPASLPFSPAAIQRVRGAVVLGSSCGGCRSSWAWTLILNCRAQPITLAAEDGDTAPYFLPSPVGWPIVLLPPMGSPTFCWLLAILRGSLRKLDALTLYTNLVCGWRQVASQRASELFDIDRTWRRCSRVAPA